MHLEQDVRGLPSHVSMSTYVKRSYLGLHELRLAIVEHSVLSIA